jgi:hypothetical protein
VRFPSCGATLTFATAVSSKDSKGKEKVRVRKEKSGADAAPSSEAVGSVVPLGSSSPRPRSAKAATLRETGSPKRASVDDSSASSSSPTSLSPASSALSLGAAALSSRPLIGAQRLLASPVRPGAGAVAAAATTDAIKSHHHRASADDSALHKKSRHASFHVAPPSLDASVTNNGSAASSALVVAKKSPAASVAVASPDDDDVASASTEDDASGDDGTAAPPPVPPLGGDDAPASDAAESDEARRERQRKFRMKAKELERAQPGKDGDAEEEDEEAIVPDLSPVEVTFKPHPSPVKPIVAKLPYGSKKGRGKLQFTPEVIRRERARQFAEKAKTNVKQIKLAQRTEQLRMRLLNINEADVPDESGPPPPLPPSAHAVPPAAAAAPKAAVPPLPDAPLPELPRSEPPVPELPSRAAGPPPPPPADSLPPPAAPPPDVPPATPTKTRPPPPPAGVVGKPSAALSQLALPLGRTSQGVQAAEIGVPFELTVTLRDASGNPCAYDKELVKCFLYDGGDESTIRVHHPLKQGRTPDELICSILRRRRGRFSVRLLVNNIDVVGSPAKCIGQPPPPTSSSPHVEIDDSPSPRPEQSPRSDQSPRVEQSPRVQAPPMPPTPPKDAPSDSAAPPPPPPAAETSNAAPATVAQAPAPLKAAAPAPAAVAATPIAVVAAGDAAIKAAWDGAPAWAAALRAEFQGIVDQLAKQFKSDVNALQPSAPASAAADTIATLTAAVAERDLALALLRQSAAAAAAATAAAAPASVPAQLVSRATPPELNKLQHQSASISVVNEAAAAQRKSAVVGSVAPNFAIPKRTTSSVLAQMASEADAKSK